MKEKNKEWQVEFTLEGRTSFYCETKEEAEKCAHEYLSGLAQSLYPDMCSNNYEIQEIYTYDEVEE